MRFNPQRPLFIFLTLAAGVGLALGSAAAQEGAENPPAPDAEPAKRRTLAIVRDGESWYFDRFVSAVQTERNEFAPDS